MDYHSFSLTLVIRDSQLYTADQYRQLDKWIRKFGFDNRKGLKEISERVGLTTSQVLLYRSKKKRKAGKARKYVKGGAIISNVKCRLCHKDTTDYASPIGPWLTRISFYMNMAVSRLYLLLCISSCFLTYNSPLPSLQQTVRSIRLLAFS